MPYHHSFLPSMQTAKKLMEIHSPDLKPPSGGPTKDEIMAISLQKLGLLREDIFADLGCGTGKISIAASRLVQQVYATDIRKEAVTWTRNAITLEKISNIEVYHGDSATFLDSVTHLDTVFIGGSKELEKIIRRLKKLKVRRVVINAVMLETLNTAIRTLQQEEMLKEVISAQISVSKPIMEGIMLKPYNPVFIITGGI